jgi:hypothetical protein
MKCNGCSQEFEEGEFVYFIRFKNGRRFQYHHVPKKYLGGVKPIVSCLTEFHHEGVNERERAAPAILWRGFFYRAEHFDFYQCRNLFSGRVEIQENKWGNGVRAVGDLSKLTESSVVDIRNCR